MLRHLFLALFTVLSSATAFSQISIGSIIVDRSVNTGSTFIDLSDPSNGIFFTPRKSFYIVSRNKENCVKKSTCGLGKFKKVYCNVDTNNKVLSKKTYMLTSIELRNGDEKLRPSIVASSEGNSLTVSCNITMDQYNEITSKKDMIKIVNTMTNPIITIKLNK
jgi:hypothetical protein